MLVHIEEATIPPGPPHELTEQVVSLTGSIDGLSVALSMIAEVLSRYAGEPWFQAWSSNSHCGLHMPGPFLFAKGKGKGKGIGKGRGHGGRAGADSGDQYDRELQSALDRWRT